MADAVDYIFTKADAMGKPCVINASIGTYEISTSAGSRDGKDPVAKMIDGLVAAKDGRAFVTSAGNWGNTKAHHVGYDVTADTLYNWFRYSSGGCFPGSCGWDICRSNVMLYYVWADTADFNNVQFGFGADDPASWTRRGAYTPFDNIQNRMGLFTYDTIKSTSGNRLAVAETYGIFVNGDTYLMKVAIYLDTLTYYYPFFTNENQ